MQLPKSLLILLAASLFLTACGGSHSNTGAAPSNVRFVNADATAVLEVSFNGAVQFPIQGPRSASDYVSLPPGSYTVVVSGSSGGSTVESPPLTLPLNGSPAYSLIAYVRDSAVVGIADERYGERICALVALRKPQSTSESALIAHTKSQLAAYKAPRHIFFVDQLYRAPNGKLDYTTLKRYAQDRYLALR